MLQHLELTNFRNYPKASFDFANTTVFIGSNGVGKTNIIEAIYLLSTGRSWRTSKDSLTIRWEEDFAIISALLSEQESASLTIAMQKQNYDAPLLKSVKINDVRHKIVDLLGQMPTVLFSPEEISLVDGPPAGRRRFLDILLCQTDRKYTAALIELGKVLKNRNKLLLQIKLGRSKAPELDFWDEKLVENGKIIIKNRQKVLKNLNQYLGNIYSQIAAQNEKLELRYHPSALAEELAEMLVAHREREIENAASIHGPHRDDFSFLLDGRDLSTFGSRGEFRTAILALKMGELGFLKEEIEQTPILLLDDIFSELDANRRTHLSKIVEGNQTIITTTDLGHIEKNLQKKAKIVRMSV